MRWQPGRGVRARATASFAAGAAVLSGALAGGTFAVAHHYLLAQRITSAEHQTYTNARLVKQELTNPGANVADALTSLIPASDSRSLLYRAGRWFSSSASVGRATLPTSLLRVVEGGRPAAQRVLIDGRPVVAIGLPLPAVRADYFEIHSLGELDRTLHLLAAVLGGAAAVTTVGGLVLGRWASGRLVVPLTSVAGVAAAVSGGALDRRLSAGTDPDLAPLVVAFNGMVDALAARIERDARFTSDVSHELRSPLTTLQAAVEVMAAYQDDLPAPGRKAVGLMRSEVNRFSDMVQDLLEISRMDGGAAGLNPEEIPLAETVEQAVQTFGPGSVPVVVQPGAGRVRVLADRRRLQRVIVNLLDNADKHGGGAVVVGVERRDGKALIVCDDAGPGVAPEERERIFERFYRGPASGQRAETSGVGLGLALAFEHVRAHSGRIWVEDAPSGGARFTVELPVTETADD